MNEVRAGQRSAESAPPTGKGGRNAAQLAVGVTVLVVAAALGFRFLRHPDLGPSSTPQAPVLAKSSSPSSALPPDSSTGSLALRWIQLESQAIGKPADQQELLRSQERELAQELKKQLSQDPARWSDVLEVLSEEDPRAGRKIVGDLRDSVGDSAEGTLTTVLKNGRHREARIASTALLGGRSSTESLWALTMAAQEDPDSGVRHRALSELAARQGRATPSDARTLDQLFRLRSQVESDPEVRKFLLRILGQSPPEAAPGAARKK